VVWRVLLLLIGPLPMLTAWGALVEQARLTQGDFVIVTAASSSVGIAAIQVARAVGATVIATTRTSAKRQALLKNGAHHVMVPVKRNSIDPNNCSARMRPPFSALPISAIEARRQK
jgi:NADPH:quinone reductase-like Zn-dependent oxidoreductase